MPEYKDNAAPGGYVKPFLRSNHPARALLPAARRHRGRPLPPDPMTMALMGTISRSRLDGTGPGRLAPSAFTTRFALAIGLALPLLVALDLVGCSSPPTNGPAAWRGTLNKVLEAREMHVGYLPFDPCVIKDPQTGKSAAPTSTPLRRSPVSSRSRRSTTQTTVATFAVGLESV